LNGLQVLENKGLLNGRQGQRFAQAERNIKKSSTCTIEFAIIIAGHSLFLFELQEGIVLISGQVS
jgi:hypothetical protein